MITARALYLAFGLAPLLTASAQVDLEGRLKSLEGERTRLEEQSTRLTARIDSAKLAIIRRDLQRIGLPKLEDGEELIVHPGHMLVYSEKHEQPKWTAHVASPDLIKGNRRTGEAAA